MIATNRSAATRAGLNLFDRFGTSLNDTGDFGLAGRRLDSDPFQRIDGGTVVLGEFAYYAGVVDYAGGSVVLFVTGEEASSADDFHTPGQTSDSDSANIRIGADAALDSLRGVFQGDVAELIAYNRALAAEERVQVEAYLVAKWF